MQDPGNAPGQAQSQHPPRVVEVEDDNGNENAMPRSLSALVGTMPGLAATLNAARRAVSRIKRQLLRPPPNSYLAAVAALTAALDASVESARWAEVRCAALWETAPVHAISRDRGAVRRLLWSVGNAMNHKCTKLPPTLLDLVVPEAVAAAHGATRLLHPCRTGPVVVQQTSPLVILRLVVPVLRSWLRCRSAQRDRDRDRDRRKSSASANAGASAAGSASANAGAAEESAAGYHGSSSTHPTWSDAMHVLSEMSGSAMCLVSWAAAVGGQDDPGASAAHVTEALLCLSDAAAAFYQMVVLLSDDDDAPQCRNATERLERILSTALQWNLCGDTLLPAYVTSIAQLHAQMLADALKDDRKATSGADADANANAATTGAAAATGQANATPPSPSPLSLSPSLPDLMTESALVDATPTALAAPVAAPSAPVAAPSAPVAAPSAPVAAPAPSAPADVPTTDDSPYDVEMSTDVEDSDLESDADIGPVLRIRCRRDDVLRSTYDSLSASVATGALDQWAAAQAAALLPGRVAIEFEGESGIGNGVQRDWLAALFHEMMQPSTGVFESCAGQDGGPRVFHFYVEQQHSRVGNGSSAEGSGNTDSSSSSSSSNDDDTRLPPSRVAWLAGCVLGLSLRLGFSLGYQPSDALMRLVTGRVSMSPRQELAQLDEVLHRACERVRRASSAELEDMDLCFEIGHPACALLPCGDEVRVRPHNVGLFAWLVATHAALRAGRAVPLVRAMRQGLLLAMGQPVNLAARRLALACDTLGPRALAQQLAGPLTVSPEELLSRISVYTADGVAPEVSEDVQREFVNFVGHDLDDDERRRLIRFWTGASALPPRDAQGLSLLVVPDLPRGLLPSSNTCYNQLRLPAATCPKDLAQRLRHALDSCDGSIHD